MTAEMAAWDARVKELYRLKRVELAGMVRERSGLVWSAVPAEKWSKDELVNELLRLDFPKGRPSDVEPE